MEQKSYDMEHLYLFLQRAKSERFYKLEQQWLGKTVNGDLQKQQTYERGGFQLTEDFTMRESFSWQDVVRYEKRPVWMMNYFGNALKEAGKIDPDMILELMRMSLYAVCKAGGLNGWMYRNKKGLLYMVRNYGGGNMYNGKGFVYQKEIRIYQFTYYGGIVSD